MAIYRFVGDQADIYNPLYQFRRFGQKADIEDACARQHCLKGVQLIPEAEFEAIGFTEDELKLYPSAISHTGATADFKRKKKTALVALHAFRQALRNPQAAGIDSANQAHQE
jgi:hypothetical protein